MAPNRTSAAAEQSLIQMKAIQNRGINTIEVRSVIAVCEKHKRMEEALTEARGVLWTIERSPQHAKTLSMQGMRIIDDAQSFDPLSPDHS